MPRTEPHHIRGEFHRLAIRVLNAHVDGINHSQVAALDGLFLVFAANKGLAVWYGDGVIWNDAMGGALVDDITPYYEILRKRFVLDELSNL
ncbi:MAG: hypothetical protein AB7L09_01760 [Nitrospira sp.]